MMFPSFDDSNGLGRNIAYAGQAAQNRFTQAATNPDEQMVGGPQSSPEWDAFFGAMHDAQDRAADNGLSFRMKFPSLQGLQTAAQRGPRGL